MPTIEADAGFAGAADLGRSTRCAPSGRSPADRLLVDDLPAGRAELALDLVRDTGALPEHVRRHGLVTM
jgi:hypothetical protein